MARNDQISRNMNAEDSPRTIRVKINREERREKDIKKDNSTVIKEGGKDQNKIATKRERKDHCHKEREKKGKKKKKKKKKKRRTDKEGIVLTSSPCLCRDRSSVVVENCKGFLLILAGGEIRRRNPGVSVFDTYQSRRVHNAILFTSY